MAKIQVRIFATDFNIISMSIGITIATVMFCFYLYQYIEEKKAAKEYEQSDVNPPQDDAKDDVVEGTPYLDERTLTGLVLSTLRKIGCEPKTESQYKTIWVYFTYQGENFTINCHDGNHYITIFDTWWYQISLYSDVDEIADLYKTINHANQYVGCTLLYTVNKEIEQIGVHSKSTILFVPQIPEIDHYLVETLNDFFRAQRFVLSEIEKSKVST